MFQGLCRLYKREIGFRLDSSTPAKAPSASGVNLGESHFKNKKQNYEKNNTFAKNSSNQNKRKNTTVSSKQEVQKRDPGAGTNVRQEQSKESVLGYGEGKESKGFNIKKLALAVALQETNNCKIGYGKEYNNCFGIKNGNTAPCKKIGRNRMCIYDNPQESYIAFEKIRQKWYVGMPNIQKAKRWSGNDRAEIWLKNVLYFYKR